MMGAVFGKDSNGIRLPEPYTTGKVRCYGFATGYNGSKMLPKGPVSTQPLTAFNMSLALCSRELQSMGLHCF